MCFRWTFHTSDKTFQNASETSGTQEDTRNQCVFDERFRIQAKLPWRKHGLNCVLFLINVSEFKQNFSYTSYVLFYEHPQNLIKTTVMQARLGFCFVLQTFQSQAKPPLRKHGLDCVLFYAHFRIQEKLPLRKKTKETNVFLTNLSEFKQNYRYAIMVLSVFSFLNISEFKQNYRYAMMGWIVFNFMNISEFKQNCRYAWKQT